MKYKYKDESELLKAVAHPMRLKIIELLLLKPPTEGCSVNSIQKILGIPQPTISQHLQILKNKGIIDGSKTGTKVCYRVIDKRAAKLLQLLKQ
ncbi:MAG: helix-turn-helix transcriptional regulator [Candidatus Aminicenantes bacterium]|nr:helix-turn-helix transcriptional regulator [Candidatus Aminicenantes bacterium]